MLHIKNIFKRLIPVVLAVSILFFTSSTVAGTSLLAYSDDSISTRIQPVINPEYQQYLTDLQNGNSARWGDHIPSSFIPGTPVNSGLKMQVQVSLPATYDSRNVDGISYITPVKDQLTTGTCWDFAAMATVEAKFERSLSVTKIVSEEHARWALSDLFPLGNSAPRFDRSPVDGGNFLMAATYLTSGFGPVLSSDVPFTDPKGKTETLATISPNFFTAPAQADIREADMLSYNPTTIKQSIMNDGAVDASIYADNDMFPSDNTNKYFNEATNSYYCNVGGNSTHVTNHDVTFVGWDDNYSKDNFADTKPTDNGAWIVKNSWGTSWGDAGYFYLSYDEPEPKSAENYIGVISDMTLHNPTDKMDIHDESGMITTDISQTRTPLPVANVFQDKYTGKYLKSVMIASDANFQGKIKIGQGSSVTAALQNSYSSSVLMPVSKPNCGYETYDLSTPVKLTGAFYSIEVDISPVGGEAEIGVETPEPGVDISAFIQQNTSFMMNTTSKQWTDLAASAEENLCIRGIVCTDVTAAPLNLTLQNKTLKSADLSWDAVIGADSYNVYQGSTKLNTTPITTTSFSATGLMQNTSYKFTVKAVDVNGESAASSPLSVTTIMSISFPNYIISASNVLTSIALGTTVDTFLTNNIILGQNATISNICDSTGKQLLSSDLIGTGDSFNVYVNGVIDTTYTISLYGDIDGDGNITSADALIVLKAAAGKTTLTDNEMQAADVNADGKVNSADALEILKYASGKMVNLS